MLVCFLSMKGHSKLEKRRRRRYSYDKTRLFHHLLSRTPHHPPPKEGAGGRGRGRVWLSKRICSLDIFLLSLSSNSRRPKLVGVRRRRKEILAWSLDEGEGRGDSWWTLLQRLRQSRSRLRHSGGEVRRDFFVPSYFYLSLSATLRLLWTGKIPPSPFILCKD